MARGNLTITSERVYPPSCTLQQRIGVAGAYLHLQHAVSAATETSPLASEDGRSGFARNFLCELLLGELHQLGLGRPVMRLQLPDPVSPCPTGT